jgi:hypothetical protein
VDPSSRPLRRAPQRGPTASGHRRHGSLNGVAARRLRAPPLGGAADRQSPTRCLLHRLRPLTSSWRLASSRAQPRLEDHRATPHERRVGETPIPDAYHVGTRWRACRCVPVDTRVVCRWAWNVCPRRGIITASRRMGFAVETGAIRMKHPCIRRRLTAIDTSEERASDTEFLRTDCHSARAAKSSTSVLSTFC